MCTRSGTCLQLSAIGTQITQNFSHKLAINGGQMWILQLYDPKKIPSVIKLLWFCGWSQYSSQCCGWWKVSTQSIILKFNYIMCADVYFASSLQNAYYNGWMCSHYCSNIITFAPDGCILHAVLNAPGSWHDSNIADWLYLKLLNDTPVGYQIISDTAFPRRTNRLENRILAPMKKGDWLPSSPRSYLRLKLLNEQLVSARQAAKWGMRSIQGSFGRLKLPLPATNHHYRAKVLELAICLHQIRCRSVRINQTQTVYESVECEAEILSRSFHNMLFSTIQRRCRISRYYNGWL